MQIKLIILVFVVFINVISINTYDDQIPGSRDTGLSICENIYTVMPYPRTITNITVIGTSPLRVRIHLLAKSSTKSIPFSVEGLICHLGFNQSTANAACRSLNFKKAVFVTDVSWRPSIGQECIMDTGTYRSVIPCEYILHQINCPLWATSFVQCTFPQIFTQPSTCNQYTHVGLICT